MGIFSMLLCTAQKEYGVSQDYYMYQNSSNCVVPLIYYQTKNNWYGSVRYNYEYQETVCFQAGKKFSKDGDTYYSVTPLAGFLGGNFKGCSGSLQTEIERGKFSFYTEPEYCIQFNGAKENFFYGWTEVSIRPKNFFYTGLALQTVKSKGERFNNEPGVFFALSFKNFELPFYLFKPSGSSAYGVAGLHWSFEK
jgi:hypothetical protein